MDLSIRTYWDGTPAPQADWAQLSLRLDTTHLHVHVEAPFRNDPSPERPSGFCEGLWEFEVVELFLFGANDQYLELELGPYGHYVALVFAGARNRVAVINDLKVSCSRSVGSWSGDLKLPRAALPAGLFGLNAFAIRGVDDERGYFALVPTPGDQPDFHRLDCWMPYEDNQVGEEQGVATMSETPQPIGEVTELLRAVGEGEKNAFEQLVPIVYEDLRRIAHAHLRRHKKGALNTTGLVHEAYLRLVDQTRAQYEDRQHFLSVSARAMRQIIISNARRQAALKRGGVEQPVTYEEGQVASEGQAEWFLTLDRALDRLAERNPRLAKVVECRYFAGLSEQETAEAMGSSVRTVQRDWMRARAWLREELGAEASPE